MFPSLFSEQPRKEVGPVGAIALAHLVLLALCRERGRCSPDSELYRGQSNSN